MSEIKRILAKGLQVEIAKITDKSQIPMANEILETSFKTVMEKDNFHFSHYEDFCQSLEELIDEGGKIFLATYEESPIATIAMTINDVDKSFYKGKMVKLCHLGVLPEYQGYGIGKIMVNTIREEAEKLDMPITFSTPEKNVNTIQFYLRTGAYRVRMFLAEDHYAVRFVFFSNNERSESYCKKSYENSAMSTLMKNWKACSEISDEAILDKWQNDFLPYIQDASDEQCEDMRKAYLRYGIMPEEYIQYDLSSKEVEAQAQYISKKTATTIRKKYRAANPNGIEIEQIPCTTDAVAAKVMSQLAEGYNGSVRLVTASSGQEPKIVFALLNLQKEGKEKKNVSKIRNFADIDIHTGITSENATAIRKLGLTSFPISNTQLPAWQELVDLVTQTAATVKNGIIGWDALYTDSGWVITGAVAKPSFVNIQLAKGNGIRGDIETILGKRVKTRIPY